MIDRLREIAEAGMDAHDRMMVLGRGVSALTRAEQDALDDYDEAFSEATPTVLALLDVAEAAEAHRRAHPKAPRFAITRHNLDAALDRLREAADA